MTAHLARLLELAARLDEVQREVARLVALARELADTAGSGNEAGAQLATLVRWLQGAERADSSWLGGHYEDRAVCWRAVLAKLRELGVPT